MPNSGRPTGCGKCQRRHGCRESADPQDVGNAGRGMAAICTTVYKCGCEQDVSLQASQGWR